MGGAPALSDPMPWVRAHSSASASAQLLSATRRLFARRLALAYAVILPLLRATPDTTRHPMSDVAALPELIPWVRVPSSTCAASLLLVATRRLFVRRQTHADVAILPLRRAMPDTARHPMSDAAALSEAMPWVRVHASACAASLLFAATRRLPSKRADPRVRGDPAVAQGDARHWSAPVGRRDCALGADAMGSHQFGHPRRRVPARSSRPVSPC